MRIIPITKRLKKNEDGNFTIEASLIFPILLIMIILFIVFSLVIYERVTLQYQANKVVSQLAHSWGSSSKNVNTGAMGGDGYVTENGDGLYWRLTSNDVFGFSISGGNVIEAKKSRVGEYSGHVTFDNGMFTQTIHVELEKQLSLPPSIAEFLGLNSIGATASHPVIEPVEIIRTTDFMLYGFDKFMEYAGDYIPFFSGD